MVYVEVDPDTYLNLNQALLDHGYAVELDYPNEFNPSLWSARVYDLNTQGKLTVIGVSFVVSLVLVIIFDRVKKRVQTGVSKGVGELKDRINKVRNVTYFSRLFSSCGN